MKTVRLPSGDEAPALGMGTWHIGDSPSTRDEEIATLQLGIDLGCTLIDTAEMYGSGRAEQLVGEAVRGRRSKVFLVSKVLPENAGRESTLRACERSLKRLGTDHLDLYLLHWRGSEPLQNTLEAFLQLQDEGKIRSFGVSNFDRNDLEEFWDLKGGEAVAANQVLYNLTRRGLEWDLLPWQRQHDIPMMAYSPIEQARLLQSRKLTTFARENRITPAHAALGWLLAKDDMIVIPKTGRRDRLRENVAASTTPLTQAQLEELDRLFPPPSGPSSLDML